MIITFFRSVVLYIIVLIVMRLMGKREIGQLQPFELAISIMIADLASIPMADIGIPIFNGIIPILGLLAMHLIISVLNLKSMKAREIICGKPSILIYRGKINVMRLMGKREIGQLQPFELAISIMIADLASIPMADIGIPIFNGIIPILGLLAMHLIISVLNLKSMKAREIICGKPSILIYRGKINEKVLKKERFTINELEERLRANNVFNLGDVEYAILETSGQVTVIQKPEKRNTTPQDFDIVPEYEGIPYDLVIDGKVMYKNLQVIGKDYIWLTNQIGKFKIKPEEALVVTMDGKGQIFCQKKDEK